MDVLTRTGLVTWSNFVTVAVVVGIVYAVLVALRRRLNRGLYLREADDTIRALLRIFLLVIDPVALMVLLAVFVAIWPFVHGMVAVLLLAFSWRHVHNYIAGRVLRFDRSVQVGRRLVSRNHSGVIETFGLTALYLHRDDGRRRASYATLLNEGYTVAGDPSRGGFYRLQVLLSDTQSSSEQLCYTLLDNPYVAPGFQLEAHAADEDEQLVEVSVGLHRAEHLTHLLEQLREAGYQASVQAR